MKRIFIFLIILALSACGTPEPPVEETNDIPTTETVTITVAGDNTINADYLRGLAVSGAADECGFSLLPEETLVALAEFLEASKQEIAPGTYEIDPAWLFEYGDFFATGNGMSSGPEASFDYLSAGVVSPDGSTLVRERYDGEEGVKGKWDGYYLDIISLDGKFESYSFSTASPWIHDWLSDRYFIYSAGKGVLFIYDMLDGKTAQLTPISYDFKAVEDGKIMLDYVEQEEGIINYSFADDGSIIIDSNVEGDGGPWVVQWNDVDKKDAVR